jgi:hypothetical protein
MLGNIKISSNGSIRIKSLLPHKDISSIRYYSMTVIDSETVQLVFYDNLFQEIALDNLPPKKKISCTKNIVLMVKSITRKCWKSAMDYVNTNHSEISDPSQKADLKNSKYLENLSKLDSDIIELIILCHKKKKINRAAMTITALNNELARRYLINDSCQINEKASLHE